ALISRGWAEADDVGFPAPVSAGKSARSGVVALPTAGAGAEGGKLERGHRKVSACGGERLVDPGRAEADDVGHAAHVAVNVRQLARVGVVAAPAAGAGAEGGKLERGHRKVPACRGLGLVDTGRAEGDDVGSSVAAYVCQLARIGVVAAPAAGAHTEGGKLERGRCKPWRPDQRLVVEDQPFDAGQRVGTIGADDAGSVAGQLGERIGR